MVKKLSDIAKELNVSTATVSRAINRDTGFLVKAETRNRIFDFIKKTGYKPNIKARSLAKGKLTNLFLILSQGDDSIFYDQYFSNIIKGIHSTIYGTDYSLVVLPVESDCTEEQLFDILLNNETAGLILSPYCGHMDFPFEIIKGYSFPIVSLDNMLNGSNTYNILLNHFEAGAKGAEFIWGKGYRDIVLVSDSRHSQHSELRKSGFYSFFGDKKPGTYNITNLECILSYVSSMPLVDKILNAGKFPIGVFALSDEIAAGLINHLNIRGIKCPGEVGILGFDGLSIRQHVVPQLSSVAFSSHKVGKIAAETILSALDGNEIEKKIMIGASVMQGGSC